MSDAARPVGSTYRLQLGPTFDFAAARDVVRYVAALGVSHVYLSPLLTARPGSTHGYDVADPTTVSEQLGGEAGLRALADAAHAAGLGILADIVPNHLGTGWDTPLWRLLLAEGHSGEGGRVFDVDWTPALPGAAGKVIVPVLGDQYGAVLHRGELALVEEDGEPRLAYHDHRFPLSPESREALARSGGITALEGTPGVEESWQRLHALLEAQHYRLVHWRAGDGLINYRRFFDIDDLAAVRVEDPHVFDATSDTILRLVADGVVDGLRVDHPDGLADPRRYLQRLAQRSGGVWTVVEKITHPGELLRDWDTAGTTGYEFCNDVLGLFVDPAAQRRFDELDAAMGASPEPYAEQVRRAKRETLAADLAADAARLARRLWALSQAHLDVRDVDDRACLEAVSALVSAFDVYRTYVDPETGEAAEADVRRIDAARAAVAATDTTAPALLVDFLADVLAGRRGNDAAALDLITRFQQLSGALTAKGVEDTVFYRYRRLVALNEVGGDPTRFGLTVDEFHARNAERAHRHPAGMVTTATHDTKRGEDVRLRIAALTQLGEHWDETLRRWAQRDGVAPRGPVDRQTASLVFQTMVAVWPFAASGQAGPDLGQRLRAYAERRCARPASAARGTTPTRSTRPRSRG